MLYICFMLQWKSNFVHLQELRSPDQSDITILANKLILPFWECGLRWACKSGGEFSHSVIHLFFKPIVWKTGTQLIGKTIIESNIELDIVN